MVESGLRSLDWLIDAQTAPDGHLSPIGNGWWPRGGEQVAVRPAADRGDRAAARRGGRPRGDRRPPLPGSDGALVRVVPGRERPGALRRRPGARRLLRRPTPTGRQHEPGRRVDADVADRRRAHPGPRAIRSRVPPRRRSQPVLRDVDRAHDPKPEPLFRRDPANPILTAADVPYPANSVFNPGRRPRRRRDDPPRPRRGPPRDLPAPRRPQRRRRHRLAVRSRAAPPGRRRPRSRGDLGLRGPAPHLAARARGMGDRLHGVQPPRAARRRSRRPATSGASVAWDRSCRPRTRTRRCSRAGSTAAGR